MTRREALLLGHHHNPEGDICTLRPHSRFKTHSLAGTQNVNLQNSQILRPNELGQILFHSYTRYMTRLMTALHPLQNLVIEKSDMQMKIKATRKD
jgi:hypothetical protein